LGTANASLITGSTETIDVGPQTSTFAGDVRGYFFTAPVDFWITGIDVPTDASTAAFGASILRLPSLPPLWSATTTVFDILYEVRNQVLGVTGLAIKVSAGDVIGVLGNRGGVNSYGADPYQSSIFGNVVDLTRFGTQNIISSSATVAGMGVWSEANGTGISRVNLTISAVPTPASYPLFALGLLALFASRKARK
jgi:hypothetical protein